MWTRNFLEEIHQDQFLGTPITVFLDNQGAKKLAENRAASERTKHIDLKIFFIQDELEANTVQLKYVPSNENFADCLTKIIDVGRTCGHREALGVKDQGGC